MSDSSDHRGAGCEDVLVKKLRRGDAQAWQDLFSEHQHWMHATCLAITADRDAAKDLFQDIAVKIYRAINTFRGNSSIRTWIHAVVRNACCTYVAGRRPTVLLDDALADVLADERPTPDQALAEKQATAALDAAIAELDPNLRQAFLMCQVGGLSYAQIADAQGVPVATVATRVHRARDQLRRRLTRFLA